MAMIPLKMAPGINALSSRLAVGAGWFASNLIRWKDGLLQKLGGWSRLTNTALTGVCRGLLAFQDLSGNKYLACGTTTSLEIFSNGTVTDITPIRATSNRTNPFSTVAGTSTVKVVDASHGAATGDVVTLPSFVAIGGLILHGPYVITSVIDVNTYTFNAGANATTTVTNGGTLPVYTTVATSSSVQVTLPANGFLPGSNFSVGVSVTVGGLTLSGPFSVQSIVDANDFTILAASPASGNASATENGGQVRFVYSISAENGPLRNWFLDAWGQILLAVPTNGALFQWIPPVAPGNVATAVATAPAHSAGFFIAMPEQIAVLLGTVDPNTGLQDPLLIRWSDVADYTDYIPTATNQAGSFRISRGSKIVGGLQAPLQALIWTDTDLWSMYYNGFPFIFGFTQIGWACGLLAPKAVGRLGASVFWMSRKEFYVYDGSGVHTLPCPVWDFVFDNMDFANADKTFAATNSEFSEVAWYFPFLQSTPGQAGAFGSGAFGAGPFGGVTSASNNDTSAYVKYNVKDGLWDYGVLARTAWLDTSLFGDPIGVDGAGLLQQHEIADDADGFAMPSSVSSGWIDISNGGDLAFVERILPDFVIQGTDTLKVTVQGVNYVFDTPRNYGPYTVTANTRYITVRARGRFIALDLDLSAMGSFTRIGETLAITAPSGKR